MIVRIVGEGQYDLEGPALGLLKAADKHLFEAVSSDDPQAFAVSFEAALRVVREQGTRLADGALVESDLVLPGPDTTLAEARQLFTGHPS